VLLLGWFYQIRCFYFAKSKSEGAYFPSWRNSKLFYWIPSDV
jgi:hypothetical protein